jgi:hypothetical protein
MHLIYLGEILIKSDKNLIEKVSAFSHMIISFFFQRFHIKISVRKYTESLQISRRERLNESNNENLSRETDTFSVRIWIQESHRECKPRIPPGVLNAVYFFSGSLENTLLYLQSTDNTLLYYHPKIQTAKNTNLYF